MIGGACSSTGLRACICMKTSANTTCNAMVMPRKIARPESCGRRVRGAFSSRNDGANGSPR
jgi:hypothetical protein